MIDKSCGNCEYWSIGDPDYVEKEYDFDGEFQRGECHRHAPRPVVTHSITDDKRWEDVYNNTQDTTWPGTRDYDWCGEFKQREDDNAG